MKKKLFNYHFLRSILLLISVSCLFAVAHNLASYSQEPTSLTNSDTKNSEVVFKNVREVFKYYISTMQEFYAGNEKSLEKAQLAFDLTPLAQASRKEQGKLLAQQLYAILDKYNSTKFWIAPEVVQDAEFSLKIKKSFELKFSSDSTGWHFDRAMLELISEHFKYMQSQGKFDKSSNIISELPLYTRIRNEIPEPLRAQLLFFEYWQWLGFGILIIAFFLLKLLYFALFSLIAKNFLKVFPSFQNQNFISKLVNPAVYFALIVSGGLLLPFLDLKPLFVSYLSQILLVFKIIFGAIFIYRLLDLGTEILLKISNNSESRSEDILLSLLRKLAKVLTIISALLLLLSAFDLNVTGLIAGLGIGSIAFALAAQNTVENVFGSITVLLDRPFKEGDFIKINDVEGTVEQIGLRCTRLRTPINSLVSVPNSKLISNIVDNLGARKYRLIKMTLALSYDTSREQIEQFCQALRELVIKHPESKKDNFQIHLNDFTNYSLQIVINVFFEIFNLSEESAVREGFLLDILDVAHRLGVKFAYPTQTLHLDNLN